MTSIEYYQERLDDLKYQFEEGYEGPLYLLVRLIEEISDFSRELKRQRIKEPTHELGEREELIEKIGDILVASAFLSNSLGIDLEEALESSIEKHEMKIDGVKKIG